MSNSRPERRDGDRLTAWMRVAVGAGGAALLAGVAGMFVWIDDGSHFFEVAVAVAGAGFLTLVASVLTRVFTSSHGSQDDAFRRGRSMGYDAGFLEGHRTARPVVVPLRGVDRDLDHDIAGPFSDVDEDEQVKASTTTESAWGREAMPLSGAGARQKMVAWVGAKRIPLLAGALCLALVGVLVANARAVPASVTTQASGLGSGTLFNRTVPSSPSNPSPAGKPVRSAWSVAVGAGVTLGTAGPGSASPVHSIGAGASAVKTGATAGSRRGTATADAAGQPVAAASGLSGNAVSDPAIIYLPASSSPASTPAVVPVVAVPAVPLTAAQQTAVNAANAAAQTKQAASAAAAQVAATAASAAVATAKSAAAAAAATRATAAAAAYAVAHPAG
jgi:hypothetical protein